jgi:hypothetical protein
MKREAAIAIARESLQKNGFSIVAEPRGVQLVSKEEFNKYLTAIQMTAPQWIISFPLAAPNEFRTHAIISVDDATGVAAEGQLS